MDETTDIHRIRSDRQLCERCGTGHDKQQLCPAIGAICRKCGRKNHFAKMCRTKTRPLYGIQTDDDGHVSTEMFIGTIQKSQNPREWQITLPMNNHRITFKIDTGAQCNVITKQKYLQASKTPLQKSTTKLVAFGGHRLVTCGKATMLCQYNGKKYKVEFEILDQDVPSILGLPTAIELNLIKCIYTVEEQTTPDNNGEFYGKYKDVFDGLGCVSDVLYHIDVDPSCQPVIHPPRQVPVMLRPKIQQELDRMESLDVIEKVSTPTPWVNSMVTIVKPNGKLRICIDPRDLNKAIRREHYPMQTIEQVVTRMPNATIFSVLDASSGYWQIKLDQESVKLCTFNSPFGRYMFKRLPLGLSSAQDVFQRVMSQMFEDIEGVKVVVDDILIWGENEQQHDDRLIQVLERARHRDLKLNKIKCQFRKQQIAYLGHILTDQGLKPDPKKTLAVKNMPSPTNKEDLQRFLGMITVDTWPS